MSCTFSGCMDDVTTCTDSSFTGIARKSKYRFRDIVCYHFTFKIRLAVTEVAYLSPPKMSAHFFSGTTVSPVSGGNVKSAASNSMASVPCFVKIA